MSNNFDISNANRNGIELIRIKGFLDAHTAQMLEKSIEDLVRGGKTKIVVNFKDLEYISSAGLGVFMVFIEEIRNDGGDIKLVELKPKVFTVFDLLGFPMLFDILHTEEEAFTKFQVM